MCTINRLGDLLWMQANADSFGNALQQPETTLHVRRHVEELVRQLRKLRQDKRPLLFIQTPAGLDSTPKSAQRLGHTSCVVRYKLSLPCWSC